MALRKVTQTVLRNQTRAASQSTVSLIIFDDLEQKREKKCKSKIQLEPAFYRRPFLAQM